MPLSSRVRPDVDGLIPKEEKVEQEDPGVHKPQVLRSLTLSKASPGAYSARRSNMNCVIFILHVMYCAFTCRVLLIDGDRLYGSTLPHIILD
jgi:hypothetical protein